MTDKLKFSPTLKQQVDACTIKTQWAAAVQAGLGNNCRLRCYHDPAGGVDPVTSGAEFLNIGAAGPLTIEAGSITNFGVLSNITKRIPTDISSGTSVLRIEGNGQWVQGSLGLPNADTLFHLSANITYSTGLAFDSGNTHVKPPRFLPSGTGPASPPINSTTPTIIELVDWTNPATPVVVGIGTYSASGRQDDWIFEDAEMAAEIGDVAIYQLDSTIKWTSAPANQRFELGGLLIVASNYNSEGGAIQLEQMLLSFKPLGRWSSYPAMDTYVPTQYATTTDGNGNTVYGDCLNPTTADLTYPPPFKVNLYTADGYANGASTRTPLFTHEIKAFNDIPTLPVNSPQLSQIFDYDHALVPHFNCGMMLPWQNTRTRASSKAGKYFNGVKPYAYGPTFGRAAYSANACIPLFNAYGQINGFNHWLAVPPYPMKRTSINGHNEDDGSSYANSAADIIYLQNYDSIPNDPKLFDRSTYYPQLFRITGYKYQIGSISCHDWRTGNGGQRFDRSHTPAPLAVWASDQTYVRALGNVPIRELVDDWGMAYFNHSNHWLRDAHTFAPIPKAESLRGDWVFHNAYYGGGPYGALGQPKGLDKTIDLMAPGAGSQALKWNFDATGRMVWGGHQRDSLHSYTNAAWWAIMLNSPMHAIAATHDFHTQWMAGLGSSAPDADPTHDEGFFLIRSQAWRYTAYALQWKIRTQHPLGISGAEVEGRQTIELETLHDKVHKPAFIDNSMDPYFVCIRNFGHATVSKDGVFKSAGGSLMLYAAHVMITMKQFGFWSVMKAKSVKCRTALEMWMACLDKATIDYILDTDGRDFYYPRFGTHLYPTADEIPANWAAQKVWLDTNYPVYPNNLGINPDSVGEDPQGYKNWTLMFDDVYREQAGNPHMLLQYISGRKTFFPEYPHARLDAALTKVRGYYTAHDAAVAAGNAKPWVNLTPAHGELNAPTSLGPV